MSLEGKIAVVTGASRGIGRAIAQRLAKDGALVVVHYGKSADAAASTVREIEAGGGKAFSIQAEVSSLKSIEDFYRDLDSQLKQRTGGSHFDILVNNAGIAFFAPPSKTTEQQFDQLFGVNVKGPFFVSQLALPRLRAGGRIVNISSGVSRRPAKDLAAYSMTKAALDALTVTLAVELGPRGITVNTLAPGYTATDINAGMLKDPVIRKSVEEKTTLGRIGHVNDIAKVASFLASAESAWVTGQYLEASGGLML